MPSVQNVLIVGGGIAGLTAALAFHKRGIASQVIEINPEWSVYGVGIIQPSNMLRALESLGLGQACLAAGRGYDGYHYYDEAGIRFASVPGTNVAGAGFPATNGITRPALHKILTEAVLEKGIPVKLGVSVRSYEERSGKIVAQLTDESLIEADLLIGADGAYSKMRGMLLGPGYEPRFTGESTWRYNFPRPADFDWGGLFMGRKNRAGLIPLSDKLMYLFLVTAEPSNPRMPPDQLHHLLRDRLAEYGGTIAELRNQIVDPTQVVYRPMEVTLVPSPWHRGRVVLIGDAAHAGTPNLAQGAAMAVEDSVLLGQLLGEAPSCELALERFSQRRFPRVKTAFDAGVLIGECEMAEWGHLPKREIDVAALFTQTYEYLMQPI